LNEKTIVKDKYSIYINNKQQYNKIKVVSLSKNITGIGIENNQDKNCFLNSILQLFLNQPKLSKRIKNILSKCNESYCFLSSLKELLISC